MTRRELHDNHTLILEDVLDANTTFFAGNFDGSGSPFHFPDGAGAASSGLPLPFTNLSDNTDVYNRVSRADCVIQVVAEVQTFSAITF